VFKELIERIAEALDHSNLPYMIIGGQAVLYYGEPRFTKDVDITLGVGTEALREVLSLITKLNLSPLIREIEDFVNKTMVLPTQDDSTGIRVDFIFSHSPYERQAIERAGDVKFGAISVKIASLEDVVIHKIVAGRARDIEDVENILLKNPDYNKGYIAHWLKRFDESLEGGFLKIFEEIEHQLRSAMSPS